MNAQITESLSCQIPFHGMFDECSIFKIPNGYFSSEALRNLIFRAKSFMGFI